MSKLKSAGLGAGFMPGAGPKARKLILDEFGRELDEEGNVVPMKPQVVSTLKVNINREKGEGSVEEQSYFDPSLRTNQKTERAKRKTFRFIEEGALVKSEKRLVLKVQEKAFGFDKKEEAKKKA